MKGTSGFQEVRSSTSRSPAYRLLQEQQHQFGTSSWHFLHTHDLIARSTGISTKHETVPDTVFMPQTSAQSKKRFLTLFSCSYLLFFVVVASVFTCIGGGVLFAADDCTSTSGLLDIKPVPQLEDIWCFVASANAVINHLGVSDPQSTSNPQAPYAQCRLYNIAKTPGIDCCSVTHPTGIAQCKQLGWPDDVFDNLTPKISYTPGGARSWDQVKAQICPAVGHGQPFIYAALPYQGIPHTYTAKGFNQNGPNGQHVLYVDSHGSLGSNPIGGSIVDYDCYYQATCPNAFYSHVGDYYDIRPPVSIDTTPPAVPLGPFIR